ncbi:hypothetical protein [Sphingomonas sp. TDK1]|uniref:hypothetical protein n=1 Tax=Sphingomonas sp. TDK1 TaxID=453247 RepID=UPI0007D909AD|nr:hypothetical protein [Sphingomonas sp. TDK1]OAN65648.1 hypothetical protein A7X12_15090 [Sphingomonas sp. TDK1]
MDGRSLLPPYTRRHWIVLAAAMLALALLAASLWASRTRSLPGDSTDGDFASDCCGSITLRDGNLYADDTRLAGYVVLRDQKGPYLLPDRFIGTLNTGIETAGNRPPRPLRLDRLPRPNHILFPDADGGASLFRRSAARPR